ncbi:STAS domain-containing protein [Streptomyces sp. NPDC005385]|uniref:STAS domain-containing protein n=1 Tax=Streptomyces sp. NPDC005385 TaxID=3157039 RepID=UPI0033BF2D2A
MTRSVRDDPESLRVTTAQAGATGGVVHLQVTGYLDYDSADSFLAATTHPLTSAPGLRHLHLDCAGLTGIDSMGLSMLLMLHRRTTAAAVILHLDNRTAALDRLLDMTGTMDYLMPTAAASGQQPDGHQAASADALQTSQYMAYRHTPADGGPAGRRASGSPAAGVDVGD